MVHMHHSQPLKMKFGTNHFLGSETLVPLQYRVRVNKEIPTICEKMPFKRSVLQFVISHVVTPKRV